MTDPLEQLADDADRQAAAPGQLAPGAPGAAPGAPPEASPNLGAIAFLLTTFRTLSATILNVQSLGVTLDDQKIDMCAAVLAPVADKYGINLAESFMGPEVAAALVAGPILWEAARQLNLELKARRAKPVTDAEPEGGTDGQPAAAG